MISQCVTPSVIPPAATSDVLGPSGASPSTEQPPPPPPPAGDQNNHLQFIAVHVDSLMGLVNPDSEIYIYLARLTDVAHGGPM